MRSKEKDRGRDRRRNRKKTWRDRDTGSDREETRRDRDTYMYREHVYNVANIANINVFHYKHRRLSPTEVYLR